MQCMRYESEQTRKDGQTRLGGQRWRCNDCRRRFTARSTSAFSNHGFADDVIALAVRWYVRYRLSHAVVAWFAERGLLVDRRAIYRCCSASSLRWLSAASGLTARLDQVVSGDTIAYRTLVRLAQYTHPFLRRSGGKAKNRCLE